MRDQLISFETAKLAKEKGFKIPSTNLYRRTILERFVDDDYNSTVDEFCTAPTQSLLQKWIREIHGINVISYPSALFTGKYIYLILSDLELIHEGDEKYACYEEALEAGLLHSLKILSNA